MKIVLIAPGYKSLPPNGWGAVESIVWDYYENLIKRGYDIFIVNTTNQNNIITECNNYTPTIVHIMFDDYIGVSPYLKCKKVYYTSHYAYLTQPNFETNQQWYFNNIFKKVIQCKNYITINAISDEIKNIYIKHGFPGDKINVICNGSREDLFRFSENPEKSDKSIYIAKIERRKSQYKYQHIPNIDFVGNFHDSTFNTSNKNYLGEWDKPILYNNLTDYANLILLSEGEADPLVIKEALIAGLGVVISECSSANLDVSKPFITVIPNEKINDIEYISNKIKENRETSIQHRNEIRKYAIDTFAWNKIIDKYLQTCIN